MLGPVVRPTVELVLCSVVMLPSWSSLAVPPGAVVLPEALVVVVSRLPAVPLPVPHVRPLLLRSLRRSLRMLVGVVVVRLVLPVSAPKFVLACRVRKK